MAVLGETEGPGDDVGIELRTGAGLEAQAKHKITAGVALAEEVKKVVARSRGEASNSPVVFVVDRASGNTVHRAIARDLRRLRSGRTDHLHAMTRALLKELGDDTAVLDRLSVVASDLDDPAQLEAKLAQEQLARVLKDPARAREAWIILSDKGIDLARERGRIDRDAIAGLLKSSAGIEVLPIGPSAGWSARLELTRGLVDRDHIDAALKELSLLEQEMSAGGPDARVSYRLHVQRAVALYKKGQPDGALASARRALESERDGAHALAIATHASLALKWLDDARGFADRAIAAHPDEAVSWVAKAAVSAAAREPLVAPPASAAASVVYRSALCEIAVQQSDWDAALEISAALLAEEHRDPWVLLHRAQALCDSDPTEPGASERWREAEQLASESIADVDDASSPLTRRGLAVRAIARRNLGRLSDCDADLEQAHALDGDDPEILRLLAARRAEAGDLSAAVDLLQHPVVRDNAVLRGMRAGILADLSRTDEARRDLERAAELARGTADADARVHAALAAIDLDEVKLASELVHDLRPELVGSGLLDIALARIAIAEKRFSDAADGFASAARRQPAARPALMAQLGVELLRAGAARDSVAAFDQVATELPDAARPMYVRALIAAGDVIRANAVVVQEVARPMPPSWALAQAANLAFWRNDLESAVVNLAALDARDDLAADGRIRLAYALLRVDRPAEAGPHIDVLAVDTDLTPVQLVETAELLRMSGRAVEGVPLAFKAARRARDDAKVQRAFAILVTMSRTSPPVVGEVAADTHVVLHSDEGSVRQYTIYGDDPVDRRLDQLTVDEADTRGLLGKKVGDSILEFAGSHALQQRWTVVEILPAITFEVRDVVNRYHDLFPDAPFFVRQYRFSTTEAGEPADFTPLIAQLEERRDNIDRAFALYQENPLPLGALMKWLGGSITDVMAALASSSQARLLVEAADAAGQEAIARAADATTLVLTRSALATADELGLLDDVAATYELIAPISLWEELRQELEAAENDVRHGRGMVLPGPAGPVFSQTDAGDPKLIARRDALSRLTAWLRDNARLEALPLSRAAPPKAEEESPRDLIGAPSYDALALAVEHAWVLYADDLGLRRLALEGSMPALSVSTVSLVDALQRRGVLGRDRRDAVVRALALRRYGHISPTPELLAPPLRDGSMDQNQLTILFELLTAGSISLAEGARVGAEIIRTVAAATIRTVAPDAAARRVLESLARRWGPLPAAQVLLRLVRTRLRSRDDDLQAVEKVCREFVSRAVVVR